MDISINEKNEVVASETKSRIINQEAIDREIEFLQESIDSLQKRLADKLAFRDQVSKALKTKVDKDPVHPIPAPKGK
jgi:predicted RNase H-like nuclease (RuvC/YqgF family)